MEKLIVTLDCLNCGKDFEADKRLNKKYCSKDCREVYNRKEIIRRRQNSSFQCPCGNSKLSIIDSRQETNIFRRRRYLCECGERFNTIEVKSDFKIDSYKKLLNKILEDTKKRIDEMFEDMIF